MPFETVPELCSPLVARLSPRQQIEFANDSTYWWLSSFLNGEQGALAMALSLSEKMQDSAVVEYAVNQAREEARHVTAFTNYLITRWGVPLPPAPAFAGLLKDIVESEVPYRQIVGMQVLVEGLAMGFMASLHGKSNDPVLVRLAQLVMTDETFHHKAGKIWAAHGLPELTVSEKEDAEDWALSCFHTLMFNVFNPSQKAQLYAKYGFTVDEVRSALRASYTAETRRREMQDSIGVFRLVIKTLLSSGIVTDRTRLLYEKWVDVESLNDDGKSPVEDVIAMDGIAFLKEVNRERKSRGRSARFA